MSRKTGADQLQVQFPCDPDLLSHLGTQLTFVDDATPGDTDVTTCSLDEPNRIAPRDHTYTGSKLDWFELADGLPQYLAQRTKPGSDPARSDP